MSGSHYLGYSSLMEAASKYIFNIMSSMEQIKKNHFIFN